MQTEAATLTAVLVAPVAVVAGVAALIVAFLVRRGRHGLRRTRDRLDHQAVTLEEALTSARGSLDRLGSASAVLAKHGRDADVRLASMTNGLMEGRTAIEGFSRGRLAPAIRAMQLASALARVALLWRMPAR